MAQSFVKDSCFARLRLCQGRGQISLRFSFLFSLWSPGTRPVNQAGPGTCPVAQADLNSDILHLLLPPQWLALPPPSWTEVFHHDLLREAEESRSGCYGVSQESVLQSHHLCSAPLKGLWLWGIIVPLGLVGLFSELSPFLRRTVSATNRSITYMRSAAKLWVSAWLLQPGVS